VFAAIGAVVALLCCVGVVIARRFRRGPSEPSPEQAPSPVLPIPKKLLRANRGASSTCESPVTLNPMYGTHDPGGLHEGGVYEMLGPAFKTAQRSASPARGDLAENTSGSTYDLAQDTIHPWGTIGATYAFAGTDVAGSAPSSTSLAGATGGPTYDLAGAGAIGVLALPDSEDAPFGVEEDVYDNTDPEGYLKVDAMVDLSAHLNDLKVDDNLENEFRIGFSLDKPLRKAAERDIPVGVGD